MTTALHVDKRALLALSSSGLVRLKLAYVANHWEMSAQVGGATYLVVGRSGPRRFADVTAALRYAKRLDGVDRLEIELTDFPLGARKSRTIRPDRAAALAKAHALAAADRAYREAVESALREIVDGEHHESGPLGDRLIRYSRTSCEDVRVATTDELEIALLQTGWALVEAVLAKETQPGRVAQTLEARLSSPPRLLVFREGPDAYEVLRVWPEGSPPRAS